MKGKLTESDILMLKYFWEQKEDIERYGSFEEIKPLLKKHKPELLRAWKRYKSSRVELDNIISNLSLD